MDNFLTLDIQDGIATIWLDKKDSKQIVTADLQQQQFVSAVNKVHL